MVSQPVSQPPKKGRKTGPGLSLDRAPSRPVKSIPLTIDPPPNRWVGTRDFSVPPVVLQLDRGDFNLMRRMGWLTNNHIDAGLYLLRDFAVRRRFEVTGLFYLEDFIHHPDVWQFQQDSRGLQIIHERRNENDSGDHWIVVDWNEEQLTIYDSAPQRIPTIARNVQECLRRLLPIQRGTEVTAFFPRVQQQFFETLELSAFPTTAGRPRAPTEALTARFRM